MPKAELVKNVVTGDELKSKVSSGVKKAYDVAVASYGAASGNALIEFRYGEPLVSHDGITNLRTLVLDDPIENMAVSIIRQASERTGYTAGDSTTLTALLTAILYNRYKDSELTPRQIAAEINKSTLKIKKAIEKHKKPAGKRDLRAVAFTSSGDSAVADMVVSAIESAGENGNIRVEESTTTDTYDTVVSGFTFGQGLAAPVFAKDLQRIETQYKNASVVVLASPLAAEDEAVELLEVMVRSGAKHSVIIGDVRGEALEAIAANKIKGAVDAVVVQLPAIGRDEMVQDIAAYLGITPVIYGANNFELNDNMATAPEFSSSMSETTIVSPLPKEEIAKYANSVKNLERKARLSGKLVKIFVGGATQAERQELKLRVEDAVGAARSAKKYGVLPGGGYFLARYGKGYFERPFELLTGNKFKGAPYRSVDLNTGKSVNVLKAGILDSAKSIEEAVVNSHSVATQLLSVRVALPYKEKMK